MADSYINNVAKRPFIRKVYDLSLTYDTSRGKMKEALEAVRDIYENHPSTQNAWVYFTDFGPHSLEIRIFHWCKYLVFEDWLKATEDINLKLMDKLKELGVEIAIPAQNLYLRERDNAGSARENGKN